MKIYYLNLNLNLNLNRKKGMVLVIVLISIIALTLVLSAIHLHTIQETKSISQAEFAVNLSNMAEGALKKALEKLQYDLTANPSITPSWAYSNILNYYQYTAYNTNPATNNNPKIPYIFSGSKDSPGTVIFPGSNVEKKYIVYIYDDDKFRDGTINTNETASNSLIVDDNRKIRVDIMVYFRTFKREFEAIVEVNRPFDDYALVLQGDTYFVENNDAPSTKTAGTNPGVRTTGHIYVDDAVHDFRGSILSSAGVCCPGGCGAYTINGGKSPMGFPTIIISGANSYLTTFFEPKCNPNVGSEECYKLFATGGGGNGRIYRWIGSWDWFTTAQGNPCTAASDYNGWCFDQGVNKWKYNKSWIGGVEKKSFVYIDNFDTIVYDTGTSASPHNMTLLARESIEFDDQGSNPIYISPYNFNQSQYKDCNNFLAVSGEDIILKAKNTTTTVPNFGGNSRGGIIMAKEQIKIDRPTSTSDIGPWIKGLIYVENSAVASPIVALQTFSDDASCGGTNYTNGSFTVTADARPIFTYFGGLNPFPKEAVSTIFSNSAYYSYDAPAPRVIEFVPLF